MQPWHETRPPNPITPSIRYDALVQLHPENDAYRLHLAHALYKAGLYADAADAAARVSGECHAQEAAALQAAIAFEQGDVPGEAAGARREEEREGQEVGAC